MKACGIAVEYNPFHNGHLYQLEKARERTDTDVMIAVMSGNFLQRGEPAIVDKWKRTEMALSAGVDLVIELPAAFSMQAADYFARGAIQLLRELKVNTISFGAESGSSEAFKLAGEQFIEKKDTIDQVFQTFKGYQEPYAAQIQKAIEQVIPNFPLNLFEPNNQLGFAYAKEIAREKNTIEIDVIARKDAGYLDEMLDEKKTIASATAIRRALSKQKDVSNYIPEHTDNLLKQGELVYWESYWLLLKYQLTVSSFKQLSQIYQMEDGLEYRLKNTAQQVTNFEEFITEVKTKQFTRTRLQRLCVYILLQVTKKQMEKEMIYPNAIRILGFSQKGQSYLAEKKEQIGLPILTNISKKNAHLCSLDILSGEVYRLASGSKILKQDFTRNPVKNVDIISSH